MGLGVWGAKSETRPKAYPPTTEKGRNTGWRVNRWKRNRHQNDQRTLVVGPFRRRTSQSGGRAT